MFNEFSINFRGGKTLWSFPRESCGPGNLGDLPVANGEAGEPRWTAFSRPSTL